MDNNSEAVEMAYDEVRDRIFKILESGYINQKNFAHMIGVSAQTITDWKTGKSRSFAKKLKPISCALGVSIAYLLGEPASASPGLDAPATEEKSTDADPLRLALLHNFDRLNQEGQERLVETSDDMVKSDKYIKSSPAELGSEKYA